MTRPQPVDTERPFKTCHGMSILLEAGTASRSKLCDLLTAATVTCGGVMIDMRKLCALCSKKKQPKYFAKMKLISYIALLCMACLASCGAKSQEYRSVSPLSYEPEVVESGELSVPVCDETSGAMYGCPMCSTIGQIQDIYTGGIVVCPACKGSGQVSKELYGQLVEADRIGRELAGGTVSDDEPASMGSGGYAGEESSGDLDREIASCEQQIANLEEGLSLLDEGSTLYAYYSQELVGLKCDLERLKRMNQ